MPTVLNHRLREGNSLLSRAARLSPQAPRDLRGFIQALDGAGLLVHVQDPIDWRFDIGRITRESRRPLLFEDVKEYSGHRVFTNGLCDTSGIALALGLERKTARKIVIDEARKRITAPIKPRMVNDSPLLQNIVEGKSIDLSELCVPHWSNHDAGRYIGTWHINVTKDPETGSRNIGVYRMQILGPQRTTVSASPGSHLARQFAKCEKKGQLLSMAVAIGVSEVVIMAAAAAYPDGKDEFELAGALQQEAVELFPCATVNLEVPAHSEIVIEGSLHPGVRVQDGPYFDYTGKTNTNPNAFLFEATRVMFRSYPIFRGTSIGMPGAEDHQLFSFLAELDLVDFHGSRVKRMVQNILLKRGSYQAFQAVGKMGTTVREKAAKWTSLLRQNNSKT